MSPTKKLPARSPAELRPLVSRVLRLTTGQAPGAGGTGTPGAGATAVSAWTAVTRTRAPGRPGLRDLLRHAARDVVPLAGTGAGAHPGLVIALARLGGAPCALVGQDRAAQRAHGPLGPADLRRARQRANTRTPATGPSNAELDKSLLQTPSATHVSTIS